MQNIISDIINCIFLDDEYHVMEEEIKELYNMSIDEEYDIVDVDEIDDDDIFTEIINDVVGLYNVGVIQLANHQQIVTLKIHNRGKRQQNYVSIHSKGFKNVIPLDEFWWIEVFTKMYKNDFIIINK